jgi:hypothetical protein
MGFGVLAFCHACSCNQHAIYSIYPRPQKYKWTIVTRMTMQDNRVPRWLVESDPSWERSIDSELGMLKWTKKGTNVQAVCSPTSMFCDIVDARGSDGVQGGLADLREGTERIGKQNTNPAQDISKYLSSRYLNPGINGPARFDLRRARKF